MNILGGLLRYIAHYKKYIVLNIVCNILMVVFSVVSIPSLVPFLRLLFNKEQEAVFSPDSSLTGIESWVKTIEYQFYLLIQEEGRYQALAWVCLFIVIIFLFKNLFRYLSLFFMAPVRIGVVRDIRNELHAKYLQLPLSYHSNQKKGDLIARVTSDVLEIEWSILNVLEALVRDPLMIIGCLFYMLYVSPSLTIYVFGMVLFSALLIGVIGSTLRKNSAKAQNLMGRVVSAIEESLSGLR
ncbi:MAG: ABC transporter transmembrane domain-containing protein, partial [Saprospiraceae bacterium]